ncbi:Uncharacterized protein Adt_45044 [Abeliophyllum distichum]|uniref:Uncharacterized protein n=1 Tax=Abeliophyllum distichum TaxID=126358 RepID=A0ABD1PDC3_9LAMI
MEFITIDCRSAYHVTLGKPTLKDLKVLTSFHHLSMKFSARRIAILWKAQQELRRCYMNFLRKASPQRGNVKVIIVIDVIMAKADEETNIEMVDLSIGLAMVDDELDLEHRLPLYKN